MTLVTDTSALVKLILPEAESAALAARLVGERLLVCGIVLTELPRAVARRTTAAPARRAVVELLGQLSFLDVDRALLRDAAAAPPPELGSLDALHLAAAMRLQASADAFVVYDRRLATAARTAGLRVESPGVV